MTVDLTNTIVPKSDQLNSDDLITGPRTFTVTKVRVKSTPEQPVDIELAESPGKPFRPSKTVLRVLITAWGKEGDEYVGRRMTLYRDDEVKWAGQEVGGIRVSALSHITKPIKLALTETRGKKKTHTVQPLTDAPAPAQESPLAGLLKELHAGMTALGITERDEYLAFISQAIDRDILSTKDLTADEATKAIAFIKAEQEKDAEPTLDGAA
jgi:hypothetical protein